MPAARPFPRRTVEILLLCGLLAAPGAGRAADGDFSARVDRVLAATPLIDGHNDLPWELRERSKGHLAAIDLRSDTAKLAVAEGSVPLMTDIPRLRAGHVGGQFWSVWVPTELKGAETVQATLEQIDLVKRMAATYPADFQMAYTAADVRRIHRSGKIASLIGIEGGHQIDNSLATLRQMYDLGARYMTLTHARNTDWADSATDVPAHHGLTPFGEDVIREMNRLGMLVDLSHVSPETMKAALAISESPVIFSHSSARAIVDHPRNVSDDILRLVASNGGVVMVNFYPGYVSQAANQWEADHAAERRDSIPRRFPVSISVSPSGPRQRSMPGTRPIHGPSSRWRRWPITSSTSAQWPASITWASAPTSTAFPKRRRVSRASTGTPGCWPN